jgi:predicted AAA+ superfamily ATPase
MYKRILQNEIESHFFTGKAILLFGPRQVGKSTLVRQLTENYRAQTLWLNGDEIDIREQLSNKTSAALKTFIGDHKILVIDEAQKIENIGTTIKLIVDNYREIQVIATGSSSFELANKLNEPLTGRKWEYQLFPLSTEEIILEKRSALDENRLLENRLIFGYYPEVINNPGKEEEIVRLIMNSYLYKDVFTFQQLKKPLLLEKLLQALALQLGSEVKYHELGQLTNADNQTIEKYIGLLEQAFVIFRLPCLNRNVRNELKKGKKVYFYDNGIRNALINNFNPLHIRNDVGALWENYCISEKMKWNHYHKYNCNRFFWRTNDQKEIDYIEERNGVLNAFEIKYSDKKLVKIPASFANSYPEHTFNIITKENYLDWMNAE